MKPVNCLLLAIFLAGGCSEYPQSGSNNQTSGPVDEKKLEIDSSRYILAADLLDRMKAETDHFVFDVRARASYGEAHIDGALSMPYGKVEKSELAAIDGLGLDTSIVTYCGCPHHLAGLAADQLIAWGYRDVRVLYEGFWYWVEHRYPVAGTNSQALTEIRFAGELQQNGTPLAATDIFVRNLRNGQLEAAATDEAGRFEMAFHVYGYRLTDRFEIKIGALDAPVHSRVRVKSSDDSPVEVVRVVIEDV